MDTGGNCSHNADNQFGPRIASSCRTFDFTLLFEDAFFIVLPSALFLLVLPLRLRMLLKTSAKVNSYKLASWKLGVLAVLFAFHLVYLALLLRISTLHTKLSAASGIIATIGILAAGVLSFFEDQRSFRPSDLLVLYFSASTVLAIPRLRSLWLLPATDAPKAIWTVIFIATVVAVCVESVRKSKFLRPPYKEDLTREQTTSFWGRGLFTWVLPFFKLGFSKNLKLEDIPKAGTDLEEATSWTKLDTAWKSAKGPHRLIRATASANLWPILSAVPPRLALSTFTLCQPFLIESSVSNLQSRPDGLRSRYGQALIGAFVLVYFGIAVSRALYQRQSYRMIARVRSGLVSKVYRDTVSLRRVDVKDSAAITLMGTNVERIVESFGVLHELWASVLEIGIAVWLLARQISAAAALPMVICLLSVVGASRVASFFGPAQMAWICRVRKRVAATASILGDVKTVKMLGLTDTVIDVIWKLRADELQASEQFRRLLTWQIFTSNAPTLLAPFSSFLVYAIIAKVKKDETLLTVQAFASLSLIALVTGPLLRLCEALPTATQAIACFSDMEKYCLKEPASWPTSLPVSGSGDRFSGSSEDGIEMARIQPSLATDTPLVSFKDVDVVWSASAPGSILKGISLSIQPGFTAIMGPVASGKSTLLASIIGETTVSKGSLTGNLADVAFCSQTPWIMDDTVRRNIIGHCSFDERWYEFSLDSCCLRDDLSRLPDGDESICGSNGSSLSGGQRQRVALARAVYSKIPVVILDDVMSGFDSKTTRNVLGRLFSNTGHFRKAGISVILATHSRRILPYMDSVVILDSGNLIDAGPYESVEHRSASVMEKAESAVDTDDDGSLNDEKPSASTGAAAASPKQPQTAEEANLRRRGGSWGAYSYYVRSAGALSIVLWIVFTFVGAIGTNYTTLWIGKWTKANEEHPNQDLGLHLGIYALLIVLAAAGTVGECRTFFINIINDTAMKLHGDLLKTTMEAPMEFFRKADTGSITNRFSQDMDLIDMTLPTHAIVFTTGAAACIVQLVIICIVGKYLAAAVPVLIGTLVLVQRYYLRTSRQLRLLDIEAKAPIYKLFIETLQGISTIRCFGWNSAFHQRNAEVLNQSQKPFYMLMCIQQWLALVLDLTVGGLAVVIIASTTAASSTISAGALGVALVIVLEFSSMLAQAIQAWTRLETSIGAVSRVQEFVHDTPTESAGIASVPADWPLRGALQFQNLVASYEPDSTPALCGVNLNIAAGEKVVLCGPSGSGKSSLVMATLLMMDVRQGQILIDDADIHTFDGKTLRNHLNVVPQDPFFIPSATVKVNLDPKDRSSDELITSAIRKVGLWEKVESTGGLAEVLDSSEWSHGEKQLMCLARAMLVPSKILILDEATSSVDEETEAMMQDIIDTEFRDRTVISVLHRFNHVERYDRVVYMRNGEIVELGTPEALMESDSAFRALYRAQNQGN